jgi:hypothetical protein
MAPPETVLQRMYQQRLTHNPWAAPDEVVSWLGAVQAQEYVGASWALGMRMQHATVSLIDQAFDSGSILRTHVLRPTWHFVTPADIRWMQDLTAPRVRAASAYVQRQQLLDAALFNRTNEIIARALQGGRHLTRDEIGAALADAGISAENLRLGLIVMEAEIDAVICSGARRDKQFTYALLEERAPQAKRMPRAEALAKLALRYFTSRGPATARDFAWWSGLTLTDCNAGLEMISAQLDRREIDGLVHWFPVGMPDVPEPVQAAFLLSTYDELFVGYASFNKSRLGGRSASQSRIYDSTIVIDGRVAGSWRRTFKKEVVVMEFLPSEPFTPGELQAIHIAAQQYAEFLQMVVNI